MSAAKVGIAGATAAAKQFFGQQGTRFAGSELGKFLGTQGKNIATGYHGLPDVVKKGLVEGSAGVAAEQVLPRALGHEPAASLGESIIRQGVGATVAAPIAQGLIGAGFAEPLASISAQVAGQPLGTYVANKVLPGRQYHPIADPTGTEDREYPTSPTGAVPASMEPESAQVIRPSTIQLNAEQMADAEVERMRYQNRIALAQAQNQPSHSYVHQVRDFDPQTAASDMMSGFGVREYR